MEKAANLFEALAASEYQHARNFYSVIENPAPFRGSVKTFVPGEEFEYQHSYRMLEEYAEERTR